MEEQLGVHRWPQAPSNNRALWDGCQALGAGPECTGCADGGFCGLGCPIDAKQSMLVTTLPAAVRGGMRLLANTEAVELRTHGGRASSSSHG